MPQPLTYCAYALPIELLRLPNMRTAILRWLWFIITINSIIITMQIIPADSAA